MNPSIRHITLVAGARPNFMKVAPIIHVIQARQKNGSEIQYRLVHTGQHYDHSMSQTFFEELRIPQPDVNLDCRGGTQTQQTAQIMLAFESDLLEHPTDLVLVVGDVNSTMACALVAKKMHIPVAHVEAGIRSFDVRMPEEINRMVTDSISDYYFTTSEHANINLLRNGVEEPRIHYVGNVMIDTLLKHRPDFRPPACFKQLGLTTSGYFVMTLHRPSNVDISDGLSGLITRIAGFAKGLPVVFPVHPRTAKMLDQGFICPENLHIIEPLGYLEFNYLVENALGVITDSGGITEETTVMGVPCLTLRENTERPETVSIGTNELIGSSPEKLHQGMQQIVSGTWKKGQIPPLWDGYASQRIINTLFGH